MKYGLKIAGKYTIGGIGFTVGASGHMKIRINDETHLRIWGC